MNKDRIKEVNLKIDKEVEVEEEIIKEEDKMIKEEEMIKIGVQEIPMFKEIKSMKDLGVDREMFKEIGV
jgi:hypothetical protein